ncbi:ComEC/Rec2 family competence protein [Rickettsiales bacterium LUAb2]
MFIKLNNFIIKTINNFFNKEKSNAFSWLIVSFIFSLLAFNYLLFYKIENNLYYCLSASIISITFVSILLFFTYNYYRYLLIIFIFVSLALFVLSIHIFLNKTNLLEEDLKFVQLTGKVKEIKVSNDTRYITLLLVNAKLLNYDLINPPTTLKLISFNKFYIKNHIKQNDIIKTYANLEAPYKTLNPKGFDYQLNSKIKGIGGTGIIFGRVYIVKKALSIDNHKLSYIKIIKNYLFKKIELNTDERSKGVATAVTLGGYSYINKQDMNNIVNSGLTPIISISGYHIGIITMLVFGLIRGIIALIPKVALVLDSKKIAAFLTIIVLLFYMLLLGDIPPALRASIMAIFIMLGIIVGIPIISINNLLLAVFVLLIVNPFYINSISFWLSFIATANMILFINSSFARKLYNLSKINFINKIIFTSILIVLISLVVEVSLLPIIVYYFKSFPIYGIISNILVTPIFSFIIMPFLFLGMLSSGVISSIAFMVSNFGLNLMLNIAKIIANLKGALIYFLPFSQNLMLLCLVLLLIIIASNTKLKYYAIISYLIIIVVIFIPNYPTIMVDQKLQLIAFKLDNNQYVYNKNSGKNFIKQNWLKNPDIIKNSKIKQEYNFNCDKYNNCIYSKQNIIVAYFNKGINAEEACKEANLIIINDTSSLICKDSLVIDKIFLQKYGTSFIYLNNYGNIVVKTNQQSFITNVN